MSGRHGRARPGAVALVLLLCGAFGAGCSKTLTADASSSLVIVDALEGASGATPGQFSDVLESDVRTLVASSGSSGGVVPTVYEDLGEVTFDLTLKNPGSGTSPTTPTLLNSVTFTRYHVSFIRADGRDVEGVDVPYAFDGAFTATVTDSGATATFVLVRAQAKEEAPLAALVGGGGAGIISTIAQVTFYGQDATGHAVSVSGQISVNFADWADPS